MSASEDVAARASTLGPIRRGDVVARIAAAAVDHAALWLLALLAAGVPLFVWGRLSDQVVTPRLAATALLTGLACIALASGRTPILRLRAVRVPLVLLAALLGWSALTTGLGVDRGGSLLGEYLRYQGLLPLTMYVVLVIATLIATARAGSPRVLLAGVFCGGVLVAGYGALQRLGLDWVSWQGIPEGRIGSAFAQPNVLGVELATALLASLGLWAGAPGWQRNVLAAGCGLMLATLLFTLSRGAWVGASLGAIVYVALLLARPGEDSRRAAPRFVANRPRTTARLAAASNILLPVVAVIVTVIGALAVVPGGRSALAHATDRARSSADLHDTSISAHTGLWRTSLEMIGDRPVLGGGPEAFSSLFASYRTPDQPGIGTANVRPESSHNFFLDQAVGLGVVGLAIVVALIGSVIYVALRAARRDAQRRPLVIAMVAALCAYYGAVFFSFSEAMTGWLPWLVMGALLGVAAMPSRNGTREVAGVARAPVDARLPRVAPPTDTASDAERDAPAALAADDRSGSRDASPAAASAARAHHSAAPRRPVARGRSRRLAIASVRLGGCVLGALLLASACLLLLADYVDARAGREAAAGNAAAAVDDARLASRLNPLERQYLYDLGAYQEQAAGNEPAALRAALATYERVDSRFAPTAYGVLSEARVMARMLDAQPQSIDINAINRRLDEGAALDPYNADARAEIAAIRASIGEQPPH